MCCCLSFKHTIKLNKIIDAHLSYVQHLLNDGQKLYSLSAHYEQRFKSNIPKSDLFKCMAFKDKPVTLMKTIGDIWVLPSKQ